MFSRVKICGIRCLEDALVAIDAGASALGFVFYKPSPRYIAPAVAAQIIQQLPPFVTTTALFVDEDVAQVQSVIEQTKIDLLQFHGSESVDYCEQFSRPYIKALRVRESLDIEAAAKQYHSARALLLDAYVKGVPGGTGACFNWQLIPQALRQKVILAGGLDVSNAAQALTDVAPFALDISGGVEAQKGVKCPQKIKEFMDEVASVNR